jgi:hypothetical protein
MSITIQVDLPDDVIQEARRFGLLDSTSVTAWLTEEVRRRRTGQGLKQVLDKVRTTPGEAMTPDEINAEVKAARKERRAREAGR